MAITFLPPIVPSPFGKVFVRKPGGFLDAGHSGFNSDSAYHYDYQDGSPKSVRAASMPISSLPSGNPIEPDENDGGYFDHGSPSRIPGKRACSVSAAYQVPEQSTAGSARLAEKFFEQTETFPVFEDPRVSIERGLDAVEYSAEADRFSDQTWNWTPNDNADSPIDIDDMHSAGSVDRLIPVERGKPERKTSSPTVLDRSIGRTAENFRRWASTFRHKRDGYRRKVTKQATETESGTHETNLRPNMPLDHSWRQKRTSNASSRFVATVKTASMSNDSMSLFPQSHRYSRVGDTGANKSSDPRTSVDSQRPSSISSSDRGALRRSIRRRQVLQEVLSSEESYVADLKALHNLFSTLLASIPTISAQTRNSVQRNVTEMLHLHEQIIDELYRVALRAATREWKHVASPLRPSTTRHRKWQSIDATSFQASTPRLSGRPMSPEVVTHRSRGMSIHTAQPAEVADVARVFRRHMARFSVYEEYCAKHEIMSQELAKSHKMVPQWSSYEAGLEALANSITSLNQRRSGGKKGFTAGDLLIKPIQRICRYPLLLAHLHKYTPVIDCPSSHAEVEVALSDFREMVTEINMSTDDPRARERIRRRWLLQDRLRPGPNTPTATQFRMLGHVLLCGVLHVAYQTKDRVEGGYMLCMMFKDYLVIAAPVAEHAKFDIVVIIYLSDAKVVSTEDGRGASPYTSYLFSIKHC